MRGSWEGGQHRCLREGVAAAGTGLNATEDHVTHIPCPTQGQGSQGLYLTIFVRTAQPKHLYNWYRSRYSKA